MVLRRVFDKDKQSHSIYHLQRLALTPGLFSIDALKQRIIENSNSNMDWDKYVGEKHELNQLDFATLESLIANAENHWHKVKKIANKIYIHNDSCSDETKKEILGNGKYEVFESLINTLFIIFYNLVEVYNNGAKPSWHSHEYDVQSEINKEITSLLSKLSAGYKLSEQIIPSSEEFMSKYFGVKYMK